MAATRLRAGLLVLSLATVGCTTVSDDGTAADAGRGGALITVDGTATAADAGGCAAEVDNAAAGPRHVEDGTQMAYDGVPPVSGSHWLHYPDIAKTLYTADERPELGQLVHSEEHGWTIIWFDQSIAESPKTLGQLSSVADEVAATRPVKVVFVPWTSADGGAFPDRTHLAMTHWSAQDDGTEDRQFCSEPSSSAVLAFVARHPFTDSGEPNAP